MDFFPPPLVLITSSQFLLSFLIFKEPQTSQAALTDCWQPQGAGPSGEHPRPRRRPRTCRSQGQLGPRAAAGYGLSLIHRGGPLMFSLFIFKIFIPTTNFSGKTGGGGGRPLWRPPRPRTRRAGLPESCRPPAGGVGPRPRCPLEPGEQAQPSWWSRGGGGGDPHSRPPTCRGAGPSMQQPPGR